MPVRASKKNAAVLRRIRQLPRAARSLETSPEISAGLKRHAEGCNAAIADVIKRGDARPALNPVTEALKREAGSSRVKTPLMRSAGAGRMLDGLSVRRISKTSWAAGLSGTHRSGLSQEKIWALHEYGFTSRRSPSFVRFLHSIGIHVRSAGVFRVPARRPRRRGLNRYLRGQARKSNDAFFRKRVTEIIKGK